MTIFIVEHGAVEAQSMIVEADSTKQVKAHILAKSALKIRKATAADVLTHGGKSIKLDKPVDFDVEA